MHLFKFLTFTAITSLALCATASQAAPLVPSTPPPAYVLENTEVHNIPAPGLKRDYDIFVSLPDSYASSKKTYPVLFVLDANYAFPLLRSISRRLLGHGGPVQEFILIGLSYAKGDSPTASRNRDYTPTDIIAKKRADKAQQVYQYGQAETYHQYLAQQVLPYVAQHFRADMQNTALLGHSYGSLLGAYILSSPSLWYDQHEVFKLEQAYAAKHKDLAARVYLLAGEFEKMKKGDPRFSQSDDLVSDALRFEKTLRARHYPSLQVKSEIIPNEDHLTVAPVTATHGVMWAFAKK